MAYNSLTYEYVKEFIEITSNSGCKLLTPKEEYFNTHTDLNIQCRCGNPFITSFKRFTSNQAPKQQCNECGMKINADAKRLTYDQVKYYIEVESNSGYKLISKVYHKNTDKLEMICNNNHFLKMSFMNFKKGKRCSECYGNKKYTYEQVSEIFKKGNCKLLSKKYKNSKQKLDYICNCGNQSQISLSKFMMGERCSKCKQERIMNTLNKNDSSAIPCSKQQKYICNLVNGELNYLVKISFLDIAFPEEKIYIEYDGSGHNLSVILGNKSQKEFDDKEMKRYYSLRDQGWKLIKIISNKDYLPSDEILISEIVKAKKWLKASNEKGHQHYIINIGNKINDENFGVLRKIK